MRLEAGVLTLILLGLVTGTGWYGLRQRRRARTAEEKLHNLAQTDSDIMLVLQATDTPLAKKLLAAASSVPTKRRTPADSSKSQKWRMFRSDFDNCTTESALIDCLKGHVKQNGLIVTAAQYTQILQSFSTESGGNRARKILLGKVRE